MRLGQPSINHLGTRARLRQQRPENDRERCCWLSGAAAVVCMQAEGTTMTASEAPAPSHATEWHAFSNWIDLLVQARVFGADCAVHAAAALYVASSLAPRTCAGQFELQSSYTRLSP